MGVWKLVYGSTNLFVLTPDAATNPPLLVKWRIYQ